MNLGELRTSIQAHGYGTDTVPQQNIFINAAYRRVCGLRRWPFLETRSQAITTVAGTEQYALSALTRLRSIDEVRMETGTNYFLLDYLPQHQWRDLWHVDRDRGVPSYWTVTNQVLFLYPTPDLVYTLDINYTQYPADLVNDSDTPVLPTIYHDILVWATVYDLALREREYFTMNFVEPQYTQRLREMAMELGVTQRQTPNEVVRSGQSGRTPNQRRYSY